MNDDIVIYFNDPENDMLPTSATISDVVRLDQRLGDDEECVVLLFDEVLKLAEKVKEIQAKWKREEQYEIEKQRLEQWKAAVQPKVKYGAPDITTKQVYQIAGN